MLVRSLPKNGKKLKSGCTLPCKNHILDFASVGINWGAAVYYGALEKEMVRGRKVCILGSRVTGRPFMFLASLPKAMVNSAAHSNGRRSWQSYSLSLSNGVRFSAEVKILNKQIPAKRTASLNNSAAFLTKVSVNKLEFWLRRCYLQDINGKPPEFRFHVCSKRYRHFNPTNLID